jgi:hypothetical protein
MWLPMRSKSLSRASSSSSATPVVGDKLKFQAGAATKPEGEQRNEGEKNRNHAQDGMAVARKSPDFLDLSEF